MSTIEEDLAAANGKVFEKVPTSDGRGEGEPSGTGLDGQVIDFADVVAGVEEPIIPRTRAGYAAEINKTLGKTIENTLHRGLLGIAPRRDLAHGEFEAMIRSDLRCSPGYMRKCRAIAKNRFLANASNWNASAAQRGGALRVGTDAARTPWRS